MVVVKVRDGDVEIRRFWWREETEIGDMASQLQTRKHANKHVDVLFIFTQALSMVLLLQYF